MPLMGPSRADALDARGINQADSSVVRALGLNVWKNAAPGDQSVGRRRTTLRASSEGRCGEADDISRLARLLRWCGMALVAGGVLMAVATLLHPSRETATTIIADGVGLVATHFVCTLDWLLVLLSLSGLYQQERDVLQPAVPVAAAQHRHIDSKPGQHQRHPERCEEQAAPHHDHLNVKPPYGSQRHRVAGRAQGAGCGSSARVAFGYTAKSSPCG